MTRPSRTTEISWRRNIQAKTLANFDRVLRGTKAVKVSCVNETARDRGRCVSGKGKRNGGRVISK